MKKPMNQKSMNRKPTPHAGLRMVLLIAAVAAGIGLDVAPRAAAAAACPQFLTAYCVRNAAGHRFTAETNPCLARLRHWHILYHGHCHGH
jgi:hypothetical protein